MNLNFVSNRNYLKRNSSTGSATMAAPTTVYAGGYATLLTINHNLGFPPVFRAYYEPFKDGVIYPNFSTRSQGQAQNPNAANYGPCLIAWADSNNLYLQLYSFFNTFTGTYPVYWVIYQDFAL